MAKSDGGPTRALDIMERALATAGVEVVTATTDHGMTRRGPIWDEVNCDGRKISRYYARKTINFYKVAPGLIPWLWSNVQGFDVIHIHALFSFSSVVASVVARLRRVPYVIRPLGTLTAYGMKQRRALKRLSFALIERPLLRHAAAVHFTSPEEVEQAKTLAIPMRDRMIPLGVEPPDKGLASRIEGQYPALKDKVVIVFLSRLDAKKNLESVLDAFASSSRLKSLSFLVVAGDGEKSYVQGLHERARRLGASDTVLWLGHVDGELKADLLARADIFVLPSYSENFGIAAVEAMMAGLPCVFGKGVAVAGPAGNDGAAIVIEPDPQAIKEALEILLEDGDLRCKLSERARDHGQKHYGTARMAISLKHLYEQVTAL